MRGIQANGISACPKHFAVNNQELRRMASDSVVDERTLRELYLTGFEIVVKEAAPKADHVQLQPRQRHLRQRKCPSAAGYSAQGLGL